jgi:hypothetical protein
VRLYLEKNPSQKRAGGVAQGVNAEFKPQYHKRKEKKKNCNIPASFSQVLGLHVCTTSPGDNLVLAFLVCCPTAFWPA